MTNSQAGVRATHPRSSMGLEDSRKQKKVQTVRATAAQSTSLNAVDPPRVRSGITAKPGRRNPPQNPVAVGNKYGDRSRVAPKRQAASRPICYNTTKTPTDVRVGASEPSSLSQSSSSQSLSKSRCATPCFTDTFNRIIAQKAPSPQHLTKEENENIHQCRSLGMNKTEAVTSGVMFQHRTSQFFEEQELLAKERPIPPVKPKQDLFEINKQLSILMRITTVQDYTEYQAMNSDLTTRDSDKSSKGKEVDRSARQAFFHSPLLSIISKESLEELIKSHEMELENEKQRYDGEEEEINPSNKPQWRKSIFLENIHDRNLAVFGAALPRVQRYATQFYSIHDYQQELPLIVYNCVERLYTGVREELLFRARPDERRLDVLTAEFNSGPEFRRHRNLSREPVANVSALLRRYLESLPHGILGNPLYEAFLELCVRPTVGPLSMPMNYTITTTCDRSSKHDPLECLRIDIARLLLQLMPRAHLSLFSYLCAFFVDSNLKNEENSLGMDSVSRMFADPLVIKTDDKVKLAEATIVLMWILERFNNILVGLYDIERASCCGYLGCEEEVLSLDSEYPVGETKEKPKSEEVTAQIVAVKAAESTESTSTSKSPTSSSTATSRSSFSENDTPIDPQSSVSSLPSTDTYPKIVLPSLGDSISKLDISDSDIRYCLPEKTPRPEDKSNGLSNKAGINSATTGSRNTLGAVPQDLPPNTPGIRPPLPTPRPSARSCASITKTAVGYSDDELIYIVHNRSYRGVMHQVADMQDQLTELDETLQEVLNKEESEA